MVMSLFILFFISFPEALLNLVIILILEDEKKRLSLNKSNIISFISSLMLMLLASCIIRPLVPNVAFNIILHSIAYTVIVTLIYKKNLYKTYFIVLLLALFFVTIENSYIPYIITSIENGLDNFSKNSIMLLLCSLPSRIFQICAILFLRKYYTVFNLNTIDKKLYKWFIALLFILTFSENYFSYVFTIYYSKMSLIHQILYSFLLLVMLTTSCSIVFKLLHETIKSVVAVGIEEFNKLENDAEQTFNEIYTLLEDNNVDEAKNLLKELLDTERKKEE
ncbi:MAG TPA: hypothetical protein VIO64_04115 [Pseudobacteroides sp.]|uniref:hypothetical protein n=1 Tax=Pseudobacteroides sp. TaxID=1968840 RepID=UPI002F95EAF0